MSDATIVLIVVSIAGAGVLMAFTTVAMMHVADRRRLLASLPPEDQRRLPPDRFWLRMRITAGAVVLVIAALWLVIDVLPDGPCGGEGAPRDCNAVYLTP